MLPVDFVAVNTPFLTPEERSAAPDGGFAGTPNISTHVLYGAACRSASEPAACFRALNQQLDQTRCAVEPCASFIVVTAGDRVTRTESSELAALLGTVDSATEATIATLLAGGPAGCWFNDKRDGAVVNSSGSRIRAVEGGYEVETRQICYFDEQLLGTTTVYADGTANVVRTMAICLGRRPHGLLAALPGVARTELGAHFASATQLEAASVFAFEQLARDLFRLGAPPALVRAALRSALEEVGHARAMGALAERFGAQLVAPRICPAPARDALAVALENAVEGCVRETYGALLAWYQAHSALDPEVRAALLLVCEDETRHAQLAWTIAQWLEPQLSEAEQTAVQRARRAAYAQLGSELASTLSPAARALIGLPDVVVAAALLAQLDAALGLRG